jgi:PhnB protein
MPYLTVDEAAKAIEFYKAVFNATESMRLTDAGGKVAHAELTIGRSPLMLADEYAEMGCTTPQKLGGSPVTLMLYVEDVDACFERAIAAGATAIRPIEDQFYGDRTGTLSDPFGHVWMVASHVEDVAPDEVERRFKTYMG